MNEMWKWNARNKKGPKTECTKQMKLFVRMARRMINPLEMPVNCACSAWHNDSYAVGCPQPASEWKTTQNGIPQRTNVHLQFRLCAMHFSSENGNTWWWCQIGSAYRMQSAKQRNREIKMKCKNRQQRQKIT